MKCMNLFLTLLALCFLANLKAQVTQVTREEVINAVETGIAEGNVEVDRVDNREGADATVVTVTENTQITREVENNVETTSFIEETKPAPAIGPIDADNVADDLSDMADDLSDQNGDVVYTPPGGQPTVMDAGDAQDTLNDQADDLSDQGGHVLGNVNPDGSAQLPTVDPLPLAANTYVTCISLTVAATCIYLMA